MSKQFPENSGQNFRKLQVRDKTVSPVRLARTRVAHLLAFLAVTLGGCALTDAHLQLPYSPVGGRCPVEGLWIVLDSVVDQRPERGRIGVKKNGYGWETADVLYTGGQTGIRGWIEGALLRELEAGGISVVREYERAVELPRVTVTMEQFFVEPKVGMWAGELHALVMVSVSVVMPNGAVFVRRFRGYDRSTEMVWTDSKIEERLLGAARHAFRQIADSLCELLVREKV